MAYQGANSKPRRDLVPAKAGSIPSGRGRPAGDELVHNPDDQLGDIKQIYDRLEGETSHQFSQFCCYRDMGEARSYKRAAEILGIAYSTIRDIAMLNRWTARAAVYDEHLESIVRKEMEYGRVEARKRHIGMATSMLEKAAEALEDVDLSEASMKDVAYMVDIAVRIERLSRGDVGATKRLEITGEGGGPVQQVNVAELSATDRRALLAEIQNTIGQRMGQLEPQIIEGELVEDE